MRIVDFHNHYYPPQYVEALRTSKSAVKVTYDDSGNPCVHYPGDYNILVPGHRDIDYREQVLIEHGVDTGKITKWMLPRLVAITREIPKTSVGKYNKKAVRDNLAHFLSIAKDTVRQAA